MQLEPEFTDHVGTPDKPNGTLAIAREPDLFDRSKAIKAAHDAVIAELTETRDRSIEALLDYGVHTTVDTETKKLGRPPGARNRKPKEQPAS